MKKSWTWQNNLDLTLNNLRLRCCEEFISVIKHVLAKKKKKTKHFSLNVFLNDQKEGYWRKKTSNLTCFYLSALYFYFFPNIFHVRLRDKAAQKGQVCRSGSRQNWSRRLGSGSTHPYSRLSPPPVPPPVILISCFSASLLCRLPLVPPFHITSVIFSGFLILRFTR